MNMKLFHLVSYRIVSKRNRKQIQLAVEIIFSIRFKFFSHYWFV